MSNKKTIQRLVRILYEDESLLAVAKPPGIDASRTPTGRADGLAEILADLRNKSETLEPANRLARYESGILLLGKNPEIIQHIRRGLRSRRIVQEYTAAVLGRMSRPALTIDSAHGSSRGGARRERSGKPSRRPPRYAKTKPVTDAPKTTVRLLRAGAKRSVVRCLTTVETTHALRAQLRSARLRLVGDNVHNQIVRNQYADSTHLHLGKFSFHHPARKIKVHINCPLPRSWSGDADTLNDMEGRLEAALLRRIPLLAAGDTDAFRLICGRAEGVDGLVAEQYGGVVILQVHDQKKISDELVKRAARWYRRALDAESVYVKRFVKDRGDSSAATEDELRSPEPLVGSPADEQVTIVERGLRFSIKPYDGYSVGLFLDHRDSRALVRKHARGADVLNLFSYTCGFSVAAAVGGARSTVSVDVSPKHLRWGRENFECNGLDFANHEFLCDETQTYLRRSARRQRHFDMIIIDPPTFAHSRKSKKNFSITRDLRELIADAVAVLKPGGTIMVSTNNRRISRRDLLDLVRRGVGTRKFQTVASPPLPTDFAPDRDYAKTLFLRID